MDPMLNANHSHFILVDDGSEGQFAKEIEFRSELEAELRKGRPMKYYKDKEKKIRIHKKKIFLVLIDSICRKIIFLLSQMKFKQDR